MKGTKWMLWKLANLPVILVVSGLALLSVMAASFFDSVRDRMLKLCDSYKKILDRYD